MVWRLRTTLIEALSPPSPTAQQIIIEAGCLVLNVLQVLTGTSTEVMNDSVVSRVCCSANSENLLIGKNLHRTFRLEQAEGCFAAVSSLLFIRIC